MTWLRKLRWLLPSYRRAQEGEMEAELRSLAEIAAADEASLGNLTLAQESARAVWGWTWLASIAADVRYAVRVLRKERSFTAVAVLSLALGIGANAAIFSIVDALLLQSLPVRDPQSLVEFEMSSNSYFTYMRFAENSERIFTGMLARYSDRRDIDTGGGPVRANVEMVTGSYFPVLGVQALYGRTISPDDDNRGHPSPVAVVSYGFWRRQCGGDPSAIGRSIHIQRAAFTVIGVAPPEFFGFVVGSAPDVWAPLSTFSSIYPGRNWLDDRNYNFLVFLGRLRPGVTAAQASAALTPILVQAQFQRVGNVPEWIRADIRKSRVQVVAAAKGVSWLRYYLSEPLHIVFGMVALVLLLASVNLMNLQAARVSERRKELAVRLAIGASRLRVARQVFTESLLLALAGGALGLFVCRPLAETLLAMASSGDPVSLHLSFNSELLGFIAAISVVAAILFGVAPAWRSTRGEILPAIRQGYGAAKASPAGRLFGRGLASLQVALSLVLVAGAILFATSLYKLTHIDTGLDRSRLIVIDVDPMEAGYQAEDMSALNRRLAARLAALPGVLSVASSSIGVYSGRSMSRGVDPEGYRSSNPRDLFAWYDVVGPHYFSTVGAHLIAGRDFDERDDRAAPKVMIVNEEFARFFFAERNPIGRTVSIHDEPRIARQIVGVVKDMRSGGDIREKPESCFYLPALQTKGQLFSTHFLVRAAADPKPLFPAVREAVRAEDPALAIASVDTAVDLLDRTLNTDRLIADFSAAFGVLALLLAAIGIYGLLSYEVARRTGEVGIRMALGARPAQIVRMVLSEVGLLAIIGVAAGGVAALAMGKLVSGLLFGLQPGNPAVLAAAALVLMGVALSAGLWPARRAARLNPMAALRRE
jgi:predicted permease